MSLIILPSEADQRKTFHALKVQPALRLGVVRGHIDPILIVALCYPTAKQQGYEDIVVGLEGMIPRKYTIKSFEEEVRKNPRKFLGWIPRLPQTQAEKRRDLILRRFMHGKPGGIAFA